MHVERINIFRIDSNCKGFIFTLAKQLGDDVRANTVNQIPNGSILGCMRHASKPLKCHVQVPFLFIVLYNVQVM